jgi:hypothetical protein
MSRLPTALGRRAILCVIAGLIGVGLLQSSAQAGALSGAHRGQIAFTPE